MMDSNGCSFDSKVATRVKSAVLEDLSSVRVSVVRVVYVGIYKYPCGL